MIFRIGDRIPSTGFYEIIWPDGSITSNGIKVFNSAYQYGDAIDVEFRADGLIAINGNKARNGDARRVTSDRTLFPTSENNLGYLNGQIFNVPEEEKGRGFFEISLESESEYLFDLDLGGNGYNKILVHKMTMAAGFTLTNQKQSFSSQTALGFIVTYSQELFDTVGEFTIVPDPNPIGQVNPSGYYIMISSRFNGSPLNGKALQITQQAIDNGVASLEYYLENGKKIAKLGDRLLLNDITYFDIEKYTFTTDSLSQIDVYQNPAYQQDFRDFFSSTENYGILHSQSIYPLSPYGGVDFSPEPFPAQLIHPHAKKRKQRTIIDTGRILRALRSNPPTADYRYLYAPITVVSVHEGMIRADLEPSFDLLPINAKLTVRELATNQIQPDNSFIQSKSIWDENIPFSSFKLIVNTPAPESQGFRYNTKIHYYNVGSLEIDLIKGTHKLLRG